MGSPAAAKVRASALTTLAADALAVEVTGALAEAGIENILLKGASISHALYDSALRPYDDVDLLVAPPTRPAAESVLRGLGFSPPFSAPGLVEPHARAWSNAQWPNTIDLHGTLPGIDESPEAVWRLFRREASTLHLAGRPVLALGQGALAFHIALHAAQHGPARGRALDDLKRALERFGPGDWSRGAALARELNAVGAFVTGLRLVPAGEELVRQLQLECNPSRETLLRAMSAPGGARTLDRLVSIRGRRGKLAGLRVVALPAAEYMRAHSSLARRGARGLAAAHVLRLLRNAANGVAVARAWRAASRDQ